MRRSEQLQDEGLVREIESDGERHTFELTEEGREAAERLGSPAPWEAVTDESEAAALEVRDRAVQVMAAARRVVHTDEASHLAQAKDVLRETRQRLYRILAEDGPTTD